MNSGTVISYTPLIIENIFRHVARIQDLCRCACVNKLWNHFSTVEISQRKKIVRFYQSLKCSFHKGDHTTMTECLMKNAGSFEEEFDQQIRNLKFKPAFCIAFANWTLWENFELLFPSHPISKPKCKRFKKAFDDTSRQNYFESVIKTALKKRLPPNCQVCLYLCQNIIDAHNDHSDGVSAAKQIPAISGYFIAELPQQGIQFCRRRNDDRDVFRSINTHNDMKSALVLMEHKTIGYFAFGLKQIQQKFNVFQNGIVFPVQIGSGVVPLFFGPNVETACVNIPISNGHDSKLVERLERIGAVAFMFGKYYDSSMKAVKEFQKDYPLIPIVGLCGYSEKDFESTDEADYYNRLIKEQINFDFICKCLLISIKY